ncbi:MAG: hydroxymethylglutaryl-CoA lyase [Acidobacteriota bacterium]|nr:hydroxymethylglutaryl-CoA lyase [Acidobacteriota bacterium]
MPDVKICDVSLRDGMQVLNRHAVIPLEARLQLVEALIRAGVPYIEVGSFVNPRVVPAMRDTAELLRRMPPYDGQVAALAPTLEYYERLREAPRVNTVALFVSASEAYSRANTRMSVAEALDAAETVAVAARQDGYRLRGYLSYAFRDRTQPGSEMSVEKVEEICRRLVDMGSEAVALSDTDGLATPQDIERMVSPLAERLGLDHIGVHLHDRRGLGITNAYVAYRAGIRIFDASVGGIGGAITVRHSVGNIATEELASMFESIGVETGIDIQPLIEAGCRVSQMADYVGDSPPPSKIILDELAKRRAELEESEGVEADLTLSQLVRSLIGLLPRHGEESSLSVTERLEEAREQVSLFLEAPTNRAAVLFSLFSMLMVSGVAALFVRVLPTAWIDRSEAVAITLFSLAMVLLLGLGLTMIQVAGGVHFPRTISEKEREMIREALGELTTQMDSRSTYRRSYEV